MTDRLIKICGLSTEESIDAAAEAGATHFGLVHFPKSPRHVSAERAAELRAYSGRRMKAVLLLVNEEAVPTANIINLVQPDIVQFHGNESVEWLTLLRKNSNMGMWKAIGVRDRHTLVNAGRFMGLVDRMIYDAPAQALPGGTGTGFDWQLVADYPHEMPWGLAGGLSPDNVAEALSVTNAPLVDVSSGVESAPGVKDVAKIAAFCEAVRHHDSC